MPEHADDEELNFTIAGKKGTSPTVNTYTSTQKWESFSSSAGPTHVSLPGQDLRFKISADGQRSANAAEEILAKMLGKD